MKRSVVMPAYNESGYIAEMVQRTIGTRSGTGGSAGAEYLVSTIRSAFPLLWAIRSEL